MTTATISKKEAREAAPVLEKVTLYYAGGMMGEICKMECRSVRVYAAPYAQYSSAVHLEFTPKGCRRARGVVQTYNPSVLVLSGWDHPEPDAVFGDYEDHGATSVAKSRYMSFDPRWRSEFDEKIASYLEANTAVEIVADYRGHNTHG